MFYPTLQKVTFFHSKLLYNNCKFHIIKDERLVSKMEGKTIFSRRLKQFDDLT